MPLTQDQQRAAHAFLQFLMSDDTLFCISGGAGVGKTFLMNHIANKVMKDYEKSCALIGDKPVYEQANFTATTNKAAEVLEKSIGMPVQTIHSFLGLRVTEDYKTGQTSIIRTPNARTLSNAVLFIDESSMINTELFTEIMRSIQNTKVVFVGDHAQMAPVGEEISPIYQHVDDSNFVFLSQAVRNADSPALMALCAQLRDTVETGVFHRMEEVSGSIEYLDPQRMQHEMNRWLFQETDNARVLAYTNTRVQDYNAYIRELRGLPDIFVPGETLVAARAYHTKSCSISVEREVYIVNVEDRIYEAGFSSFTPDGEPILYRRYDIQLGGRNGDPNRYAHTIPVPLDPEKVAKTLKSLARAKAWSEYFALKNGYADLRNKDACTVYKAQGSTYETVFIDIGNIGTCFDAKQVARMLFVAVSRARSKVFFYGQLPGKYVGDPLPCPPSKTVMSS